MQFKIIGEILSVEKSNTGLSGIIEKLKGLDDATQVSILSMTKLSNAEKIATLSATLGSKAAAEQALGITSVGTASTTATVGVTGLGAALKGLWASNPFLVVAMGASVAITAITGISSAINSYKQEQVSAAQEAATAWSESNDSIQSQIDKITELRTALDSGTLSEQEAYQAKSDLFEIQQSLTESYGQQVAGIDLVNGSLREQISVLEELSQAEANKFLNENRAGIAEAEKQMTKQLGAPKTIFGEGGLFLTQLYTDGTKASDVLQEIFSKYQDFITMEDAGDGINTNVYFNGNAEDAENVLGQLMTDIRNAEDEIGSSNIFKQLDTNVTNGYNDAKDTIEEYKWLYDEAQKAKMVADEKTYKSADGQAQSAAKWIKDYAEAIDGYNEALLTGDTSKISEAATQFNAVDNAIQSLLGDSGFAEYADQVAEVRDQLNDAAIANTNFKNALNGNDTSTIGKNISIYADTLKNLGLTDLDFKYAFETDGIQDGEDAIESLVYEAQRAGIISDTSSEQVQNLIDMLVEAGVLTSNVADGVGNTADSISSSMDSATESTKLLLSQISAIESALSSQSTGKSIDLETFNSEELKDYQSALEYVNGTMQINAEKAEAIAKAKADEAIAEHEASKAQAQAKYLENAKEIDVLRESMASMDKSSQEYLDTASRISDLSLENDSIVSQCNQWDLLNDSIREATGTYQAWLNAQNVGDSGDMASDVRSAMSNINEVFDSDSEEYGRYYTPKYEAAVDFLVPEEVSSQGQDAVKKYTDNLSTYFTGDMEGAQKYVGEAIDKGLMEWSPDGKSVKIAAGKTMKDFADAFDWTDEVTQAMFGDLQTYFGQDAFSWIDESVKTIGDLGVMANEASESLRGIEGNETLKINLDVSEFDTKEEKISALDSTIQEMNNLKAKPGVD